MSIASSVRHVSHSRKIIAWAVPVVVAGVVVAGVALGTADTSSASPTLQPRTAAQLLVAIQGSSTRAFSGQVSETAKLGLPDLPGSGSSASLTWQSFVTGTHQVKIWVNGPDKQRSALLGELSEADVIHNGNDVWTYTSDTNTVTHTVLKRGAADRGVAGGVVPAGRPSAGDYNPAQVAARVLKAIDPSTAVAVGQSRRVAGQDAYTLTLSPRDHRSTIRKVTVAIDAQRFVPLQVQVFGAGSAPAFSIGFSDISFKAPAASIFAFHQPAGSTVSTNPLTASRNGRHERVASATRSKSAAASHASPKIVGAGWTSVLEVDGGLDLGHAGGMLTDLTTVVGTSGNRLLHTALINAVLLPGGRVFVGAVSPAFLEHIAATTAH